MYFLFDFSDKGLAKHNDLLALCLKVKLIIFSEFNGEMNLDLIGNRKRAFSLEGITISSFGTTIPISFDKGQAGSLAKYLLFHTHIDVLIEFLFLFMKYLSLKLYRSWINFNTRG
ncbi:hypothetical protein XBP1_2820059 [Xenorhabdus bovienii str. puntauvense]|uniref:Uncharacterized protein n=1 Tax=Xenorhabdus bovienii str. puntauvense TaxID=1398201 RepID=A0A077N6F4_XENBV|nr:hypothetical protein XBP1_2820059 [Xenorhabdus bovienii str. puntauvense]